MARSRSLDLEWLESRDVPALFGVPWADPGHLTLSFVPNGTDVDGSGSVMFSGTVQGTTAQWETAVLRAAEAWAATANINISVVPDDGSPLGTDGASQGDRRFGDIRVAARPLSGNVLAITTPPGYLGGTRVGDIILNSSFTFNGTGSGTGYDLYSVALHEFGHALGLPDVDDTAAVMDDDYQGVRVGLSAEDMTAVQRFYGARAADTFEPDDAANKAANLGRPSGAPGSASIVAVGDITTPGDVDYYKVKTLQSNPNGLTVRLNAGFSLLTPKLTVYAPNGTVVGTTQAADPQTGVLSVSLSSVQANAFYTIKVEAAGATYGVGGYQLRVVSDPNAPDVPAAWSGVALDSTQVGHTLTSATNLATAAGYAANTHYTASATLAGPGDLDTFKVNAPHVSHNQQNVLTINVRAIDPTALAPVVQVYDKSKALVASKVLANGNGTYIVQIAAATSQNYTITVGASDAVGTGLYQLDVDFRAQVINLAQLAGGTLSAAATVDYTSLTINRSQLMYFVLTGSAVPAGVQAGARMAIFDSAGHAVSTLFALAGQTVSESVYLGVGTYTMRFEGLAPAGTFLPTMNYTLQGVNLTDPISTVPNDPTLSTTSPDYILAKLAATIYGGQTYDLLGDVIW